MNRMKRFILKKSRGCEKMKPIDLELDKMFFEAEAYVVLGRTPHFWQDGKCFVDFFTFVEEMKKMMERDAIIKFLIYLNLNKPKDWEIEEVK
jgi:hypothetical protein